MLSLHIGHISDTSTRLPFSTTLVGKQFEQALHIKLFTLFGASSAHILFQKSVNCPEKSTFTVDINNL